MFSPIKELAKKGTPDNPNIIFGPRPPEDKMDPHSVYIEKPNPPRDQKPSSGGMSIAIDGEIYPIRNIKNALTEGDAVEKKNAAATVASWSAAYNQSNKNSFGASRSFGASSSRSEFGGYKSTGSFSSGGFEGRKSFGSASSKDGCSIS